jgi:hypothetical protein
VLTPCYPQLTSAAMSPCRSAAQELRRTDTPLLWASGRRSPRLLPLAPVVGVLLQLQLRCPTPATSDPLQLQSPRKLCPPKPRRQPVPKARRKLGIKTVSKFFGIPETDFEIFRSNSSVTVFFENEIGLRNFLSESVSESAWCFTDRFLRLPVFVRNYRICVSEFSGIVSRNFSELCLGIFQHVIFRIACTSLDKDYLFLYFLDTFRFFLDIWCWKVIEINDLVFSTH